MTERKPSGMSFTSWIDQQIHEAMERGAFDDLPGAGKPLPSRIDGDDDGQAWLRDYLRREGVSADVLLPAPLKLRKQISRLAEAAPGLESEQDVRDAVAELNHQIRQWRLIPLGPPIFVPLVDEDAMLSRWRESHPQQQPSPSPAGHGRARAEAEPARPRRWRRRKHRATP
jgi:hypothetical protein